MPTCRRKCSRASWHFAAGLLISSLGIELAYRGDRAARQGLLRGAGRAFISSGFAAGATVYCTATRFLDRRGAAVRSDTRLQEYALERRQEDIELLSKCDLLGHLPPEAIDKILVYVSERRVGAGEIIFHAGDPGDALYIVARGRVEVLQSTGGQADEQRIAELDEGKAFGEMALLSGAPRTATVRAVTDGELLRIGKDDFDRLVASDRELALGLQRLSYERAISNLTTGGGDPGTWARVATMSLDRLSKRETDKMLTEVGHNAGIAIVLGDLLDTIPGLLVVGAKFTNLQTLSLTVMMGIFIGGIPESAASATLLRKAGFKPRTIYGFWSITLSAVAGKVFIGSSDSLSAVLGDLKVVECLL
jgi:CRP-like cAMP-binding protein